MVSFCVNLRYYLKKISLNSKRFKRTIYKLLKFFFKLFPIFSILLSLCFLICLIGGIVWLFANLEWFELKSKNELGDAFGGLSNPIIAFIGVIVTFMAFYIQYQFNREQSKLIDQQRKERIEEKSDRDIESYKINFDKKFYELLRIHIDIVNQFNIDNRFFNRKTFVKMHNEFVTIYNIVQKIIGDNKNVKCLTISYSIFFHGIEQTEIDKFKLLYKDDIKLIDDIYKRLSDLQCRYSRSMTVKKDKNLIYFDPLYGEIEFAFYPFDGHSHRLGHYFRHLINFLEIIDEALYFDENEKKQYMSILRSQLSNYEQSIIYYNALAWYQKDWYKFIVDYKLLKNLPLELTKIDKGPAQLFRDEIKMFKKNNEKLFFWVSI